MKCFVTPVINTATGTVTKKLKQNLKTTPGKHPIDCIQNTVMLGTSHVRGKW